MNRGTIKHTYRRTFVYGAQCVLRFRTELIGVVASAPPASEA